MAEYRRVIVMFPNLTLQRNSAMFKKILNSIRDEWISASATAIVGIVFYISFNLIKAFIMANINLSTLILSFIFTISVFLFINNFELRRKPKPPADTSPKPEIYAHDYNWARAPNGKLHAICLKCSNLCVPNTGLYDLTSLFCRHCKSKHFVYDDKTGGTLNAISIHSQINQKHPLTCLLILR